MTEDFTFWLGAEGEPADIGTGPVVIDWTDADSQIDE